MTPVPPPASIDRVALAQFLTERRDDAQREAFLCAAKAKAWRLGRAEIASNAAMLARQCDLAREAEAQAAAALRARDEARSFTARVLSALQLLDASATEMWTDCHEWARFAREQRAASADPDHATNMPSAAGIARTDDIIKRSAVAFRATHEVLGERAALASSSTADQESAPQ